MKILAFLGVFACQSLAFSDSIGDLWSKNSPLPVGNFSGVAEVVGEQTVKAKQLVSITDVSEANQNLLVVSMETEFPEMSALSLYNFRFSSKTQFEILKNSNGKSVGLGMCTDRLCSVKYEDGGIASSITFEILSVDEVRFSSTVDLDGQVSKTTATWRRD